MNKINPFSIIMAHLSTLRDYRTNRLFVPDLIIFYLIPVLVFCVLLYFKQVVSKDVFSGSASVFGIFAGLLMNVQVAVFGIFLRKWDPPSDSASQIVHDKRENKRRLVLREINANISYLILICCISIGLSMLFLGLDKNLPVYAALLSGIYAHVLLTMLMTSKRAFLLFDSEYQR